LREKWEGRGAIQDEQMNGRGETGKDALSKKAVTYKK
jgi:hypothetical protein